jgi:uncharacterized protein YdbL (DUF1318 family)
MLGIITMKELTVVRHILGYALLALGLAACVTINIYFPAAAAEEAARTIVRDVLKEEDRSPAKDKHPKSDILHKDGPQGNNDKTPHAWTTVGSVMMNFFIPQVQAAPPNIDINSPSIHRLRASMSSRQSSLSEYYRLGALGFTNHGMVKIRNIKLVSLPKRSRIKKLVADENGDRKALYAEIAKANGHPEWTAQIQEIFAQVWVEEAPTGYWYQNIKGAWMQKK